MNTGFFLGDLLPKSMYLLWAFLATFAAAKSSTT